MGEDIVLERILHIQKENPFEKAIKHELFHPLSLIEKTGLVQVVGLPYSGKTILANFLASVYPKNERIWITQDEAFSFSMERVIKIESDFNNLLSILRELYQCGDIAVIIDPIFVFEALDERNLFFEALKGFSQKMLLIVVNKIMYDSKKRVGRTNEKMWGGNIFSTLSDYIFNIKRYRSFEDPDECEKYYIMDIIKSRKTIPVFGVELVFDNGLLDVWETLEKIKKFCKKEIGGKR